MEQSNNGPLRRNPIGMQIQIIVSGVVALLLAMALTWMFSRLFHWTSAGGATISRLSIAAILLLWLFGSLVLYIKWRVNRYEIGDDAILVHAKAGKFGKAQTLYRYESISSIRMTQGYFGKRFGYGDIRLMIPKHDRDVVLTDIQNPVRQMELIQRHMSKRSTAVTTALVA